MFHDPCNPVPATYTPKGLPLQRQHVTLRVFGHPRQPAARESHVVTTIAPLYIGCDHHGKNTIAGMRMDTVHFPPPVDIPATILLPNTMMRFAPLANTSPVVIDSDAPVNNIPVSMPEPSGAVMFLFAVLVAWSARRFNTQRETKPVSSRPTFEMAVKIRRRHRCRPVAPYCALRMQTSCTGL